MKKILNQDLICSLIFIALGMFFLIESISLEHKNNGLGAEYFPKIISIGIILLSIIYLIKSLKNREIVNYFKNNNYLNKVVFFKTIGTIIIFLVLWPYIPFILLSSLYLITLSFIFKANFMKSLLFSVAISATIYFVFSKIFHVMLK